MIDYGFEPGYGSFTDIGSLNHLGVAGYNFGTGYHGQHTKKCFADLRETRAMAKQFAGFWHEQKDTPKPWVDQGYKFKDWRRHTTSREWETYSKYDAESSYRIGDVLYCDECGYDVIPSEMIETLFGRQLCRYCHEETQERMSYSVD